MDKKQGFETIVRIVERAECMGIARGGRFTEIMDIENANKQFNLRLEDMLAGSDFDFAHDFTGIQDTMNRETGRIECLFVPRFAGHHQTSTQAAGQQAAE